MNNKELILGFLNDSIQDIEELKEDYNERNYQVLTQAYELSKEYFKQRFEMSLKAYNNDDLKAYDNYVTKQLLEDFSKFASIEYPLVAKQFSNDENYINAVRKQLNSIHNLLCHEV